MELPTNYFPQNNEIWSNSLLLDQSWAYVEFTKDDFYRRGSRFFERGVCNSYSYVPDVVSDDGVKDYQ